MSYVRVFLLALFAACASAQLPQDYYSDAWRPILEAPASGLDLNQLQHGFQPVVHNAVNTGDEYVLTVILPGVSAKDIRLVIDDRTRKVTVTAISYKLGASSSRNGYSFSQAIPPGFSTVGRWRFTPEDTLTIAFPRDQSGQAAQYPDVHTSFAQRGSGIEYLGDGVKATYSGSQFETISETHRTSGGVPEKPQSRVTVRPAAASAACAGTTTAILSTSVVLVLMTYLKT